MTVTQMSKQAGKSVSPDSDRLADQIYRHFFGLSVLTQYLTSFTMAVKMKASLRL